MMAAMTEHVEGRLAFLKTELKITDAQMPRWNTFAEAVRANAKEMEQVMQGGMMGTSQSASLPEKLAMREKSMYGPSRRLTEAKDGPSIRSTPRSVTSKETGDEIMLTPMGMM